MSEEQKAALKAKQNKVSFIEMELNDIKNNKGVMTM
jgi:hypothetical protein